jgi:uncharacterized membrane protein YuzA (DUF378 family)
MNMHFLYNLTRITMNRSYVLKKLYMIGVLLLIAGGFNAALCIFTGKDLITSLFGRRSIMTNALFLGMGVTALLLAFCRDFYLPFLGETVMPCSVLSAQKPEGADTNANIHVTPGAKVMYWAAEPKNEDLKGLQDWRKAYLGFRNAGVAVADANGNVELSVRNPQAYSVPMKGKLNSHIHYRVCRNDGMMDRVETTFLNSDAPLPEGFVDIFVPETEHSIVQPATAVQEINQNAARTAAQSLMTESGAFDEAEGGFHGAALGQAF